MPAKAINKRYTGDSMKMGKFMKIAPFVLAFMMLVPIGVMASPPTHWYSGTDESTISSSGTASWNGYITQNLGNVPVGNTFSWNNNFHNQYGSTTYPMVDVGDSWSGQTDRIIYPGYSLNPGYSTGVFGITTVNVVAVSGGISLCPYHQYWVNGPSVSTSWKQTYTGV